MTRSALLALALLAACASPTAPTDQVALARDARVKKPAKVYVCYTQPRTYCAPAGTPCWKEVDYYTQTRPCPKRRIR